MAETVTTTTVLAVRLPSSIADAIKRLAVEGGRSVEAEMRRAVREYVEAHDVAREAS